MPILKFKIHPMKNTLLAIILLTSFFSFAQKDEVEVKQNELKMNTFNLIVFKTVDFSYEYLLNSESSIGASLLFNLQDINDNSDGPVYYETLAITPYYRHFFSRRYAWGFFLEAFGMYNQQKTDYYEYYDSVNDNYVTKKTDKKSNNFAIGMSVGGKFVTKKGFLFEFYGGVGRNLIQSDKGISTEIVPRVGASLGYRF